MRKMTRHSWQSIAVAGVVAAGLAVARLTAEQAPGAATVFEGARVVVGDGSAPIENAAIVVAGGRIDRCAPQKPV